MISKDANNNNKYLWSLRAFFWARVLVLQRLSIGHGSRLYTTNGYDLRGRQ